MSGTLRDQFKGQQFINLETYRKNGESVRTPVWFVEGDGVLYVRTGPTSGKVKRLRRNPAVKAAPCKYNGDLLGEWVPAEAKILDETQGEEINRLFGKKYGFQKWLFELMGRLRHTETASIGLYLKE